MNMPSLFIIGIKELDEQIPWFGENRWNDIETNIKMSDKLSTVRHTVAYYPVWAIHIGLRRD